MLAGQWQAQPSVEASETFTDNVALAASGREESDFVTQVIPGIAVHGQGSRSALDLSYRLQNLIYASDGDRNATRSQLYAKGNVEVIKDRFFVDAKSSITQQIVDINGRVAVDNINLGNRADVITYGVGPSLKLRWKSYVESDVRVDVDRVENEASKISDAQTLTYFARLVSGANFRRLLWSATYRRQDLYRDNSADTSRASSSGEIHYRLSPSWNLLGLAGYEDNSLAQSNLVRNGSYWSAGLEWKPSRKLTASATGGVRSQTARISLQPLERASLVIGYQNRDVGLILGNSWDAKLIYRTRLTTWQAYYSEDNTATQTLQITGQQFFVVLDANGDVVTNPTTGQPLVVVQNIFGLSNDEFIRKRGQLSFAANTAKSDVIISAFNEMRTYLVGKASEDVVGLSASWNWKFSLRTHGLLGASWQRRNPRGADVHDGLWNVNLSLIQAITRDAKASVSYSYLKRDYIPSVSYHENRLTLQLVRTF